MANVLADIGLGIAGLGVAGLAAAKPAVRKLTTVLLQRGAADLDAELRQLTAPNEQNGNDPNGPIPPSGGPPAPDA